MRQGNALERLAGRTVMGRHRRILENDASNPCIGCGPHNPVGLRLAFHREDDAVTAALAMTEHWQGWPGRLHSGVLYTAMLECANWTVYGLKGRIGLPTSTSALGLRRWVGIDEPLALRGRIVEDGQEALVVRVEATTHASEVVAELSRRFTLPDRASFLAKMGYDEVPSGLEGALPG